MRSFEEVFSGRRAFLAFDTPSISGLWRLWLANPLNSSAGFILGPGGPWFREALPGKSKPKRPIVSLHHRGTGVIPFAGALNDFARPASKAHP